jgi:Flp pilus assembly protein CpaB
VNTAQAEALQLATKEGDISLTLRNPTDETPVASKGTVWDSSKIGIMGGFFDDTVQQDDNNTGSTRLVEVYRGSERSDTKVPK